MSYLGTNASFSSNDDIAFTRPVISRLIQMLEIRDLPNLSPNEKAHLIVLIQTTLEVRFSWQVILK